MVEGRKGLKDKSHDLARSQSTEIIVVWEESAVSSNHGAGRDERVTGHVMIEVIRVTLVNASRGTGE